MLSYSRQHIDDDDVAAVVAALRSDHLTQGPAVAEFERAIADTVGARYAVAFSSGTAGLHGAAAAADIGEGDLVAVPSLTFVATANCARYVGADIEFVDIDPATLNIDLAAVPADVTALVVTHYAGLPVDLRALPHRPRVVIEDAAHALGAVGPDGEVGNCAWSDMCVFSFHAVKSITSAEGGMVTTNSEQLAERLRRFRHHGISYPNPDEPWNGRITEAGYNYRLSDVHAALGRRQLMKLGRFIQQRNDLADRYDALLRGLPLTLPPRTPVGQIHSRHLYPIRVHNRSAVFHAMRDAGIGVQVHYVPVHNQPRFAEWTRCLPSTEAACSEVLSLPLFPDLRAEDQDRVVDAILDAVEHL